MSAQARAGSSLTNASNAAAMTGSGSSSKTAKKMPLQAGPAKGYKRF